MKVSLVIVNIDRSAELLAEPSRFSSQERLASCAKIKNPLVRAQGYAAELALSYALSGDRFDPPVYRREKNGKPVIEDGYVSLSHSGKYAVCAYYPSPVGVDLEVWRDVRPSLAKRLLSDSEKTGDPDSGFLLRKFVVKEAFLKMTGEGITGGFRELTADGGLIYRRGEKAAVYRTVDTDEYFLAVVSPEEFEVETVEL